MRGMTSKLLTFILFPVVGGLAQQKNHLLSEMRNAFLLI